MQRDTEAPVRSGRLAPGNSEAPADDFRRGPGCGWRPSPDGPTRRGGALLSHGGGTLMRGAACVPGGLSACRACRAGWSASPSPWRLECCRGGGDPGPEPPGCSNPRAPREEWSGGQGPWRSADIGRRAGGGSGPIVVNPSAHD
ncbi:hypothetical protein NDU88_002667 [Pleurodeles waltl]|uniref:Uncharacterized protein n=1 Tax=Pleurodeles waltl TaxID=8319 RepID=A0AAV7W2T2_PLEWA|nr:hypothetical protein NDU88_002667 [Pleurodeles waltl]